MYAVFELQQYYTVKPVYCDHPREQWNMVIKDRWSLNTGWRVRIMVFNATFNNISVKSWWSVL